MFLISFSNGVKAFPLSISIDNYNNSGDPLAINSVMLHLNSVCNTDYSALRADKNIYSSCVLKSFTFYFNLRGKTKVHPKKYYI